MYKLPEQVRQVIVNYLGSKPYAEVYQIIHALSQLEKTEEEPPVENPKKVSK